MGYEFTELADQDLQDISYHIALDNEKAAQRVYKSILDTCAMVARQSLSKSHLGENSRILFLRIKGIDY